MPNGNGENLPPQSAEVDQHEIDMEVAASAAAMEAQKREEENGD